MTVTAVLKPPTVEVEPLAPASEVAELRQPNPAPVKEEIIKEPAQEEIPEPTAAPEKEIAPTPVTAPAPAPEFIPALEPIVDHAKTSPEPVPEIVVDRAVRVGRKKPPSAGKIEPILVGNKKPLP